MSGYIKFNNGGQIRTSGSSNSYALTMFGQPDNFSASLFMATSANNTNPRFECVAGDGTNKKSLVGKLDSSLVWDGKNIVRTIDGKTADVLGNINLNHIYVKETWKSGTSWYRVWSDGYIEQGGRVTTANTSGTVTYSLSFSNTNYTLTTSEGASCNKFEGSSTDVEGYDMNIGCTNGTKTSFRYSKQKDRHIQWYAQGY